MTRHWPVQDAKARFSEFLDASVKEGPQIVTRRGVEMAVLVPIEEWKRIAASSQRRKDDPAPDRPTLKDLLLHDARRFELDIPERGQFKHRTPPEFE